MAPADLPRLLAGLFDRVAGLQVALYLDRHGSLVSHAGGGGLAEAQRLAVACQRLARETAAAADRLGHGPAAQIVLEAERATLALLPAGEGCLCLLLGEAALVGQALFEARRLLLHLPPPTA